LTTACERGAFLARTLGLSAVLDCDRFGAGRRELERVGRSRLLVRRQIGSPLFALTSFTKPAEISLLTTFCAAPPWSVGEATKQRSSR
jgi:hypothetical protein